MYYEINVSLGGRHYFATAKRSGTSFEHIARLYEELCLKFPSSDGFEVTVSCMSSRIEPATEAIENYLKLGRM